MKKNVSINLVKKNLALSIIAQGISMIVSFVVGFIVPKSLNEFQYAYWQTFVLYVGYVGILHFGMLDGIVLRYSEYDYEELDKSIINSQFRVLASWITLCSIVTICISFFIFKGTSRIIIILVAIGMMTKNLFTYMSYILQITNRIKKYALIVITQRVIYVSIISMLILLKNNNFIFYCLAELVGDIVASIVGFKFNSAIFSAKIKGIKFALQEAWINVQAGIILMAANWASMLFVGMAKIIIQLRWDILTFGKVSFSFSIANLFLSFVSAMSVVLFPTLKRMRKEQLPSLYQNIRGVLSAALFTIMILYFPGCLILKMWLPKYSISLYYLGYLLPIIIFTSKVSMLTNNYLKAYRKEKKLFVINIVSISIGIGVYLMAAYLVDSLIMLLIAVVGAIMLRSVLSEIEVMKIIGKSFVKDFCVEVVMTIIFILLATQVTGIFGGAIYCVVILIYNFYNKALIQEIRKANKNRMETSYDNR